LPEILYSAYNEIAENKVKLLRGEIPAESDKFDSVRKK